MTGGFSARVRLWNIFLLSTIIITASSGFVEADSLEEMDLSFLLGHILAVTRDHKLFKYSLNESGRTRSHNGFSVIATMGHSGTQIGPMQITGIFIALSRDEKNQRPRR